mmetsp:Transcript_57802/g.122971  ORF Transcript_57802/g.122971 Transcript_57802/m.122971 type:complete len:163 (-) Transcript_57802:183-671(-)|eukprot:CAMPEP_0206500400 /NCGR_PEP_ID=MMETSP0324_2-20121206/52425_1 /ASSEMBLY_ACC=CAM_ASM_000836 /TAXON_ID=2866 /ORGANISM="Crypthecodinium cohnii, Strain Seligo" /LENGTH=162 /DNA_ID=CAMNT_0053987487 /DNA_START=57 /DNA_END=545 /DNA_ORIENTATION=-
MNIALSVLSFAGSLLLLCISGADGHSTYVSRIPNGNSVVVKGETIAALGHVAARGHGSRNTFGKDFHLAGNTWTTALCEADSDGDGASNGLELGDPNCTWTYGTVPSRVTELSHPGLASSVTSATVWDIDEGAGQASAAERVGQGAAIVAAAVLSTAALIAA